VTDVLISTLQTLIAFGIPAAVIVTVAWLRHRQRRMTLDLLRSAVQAGRPLPPELVQALAGPFRSSAERDRRRGVLLLGAGVGLVVVGVCAFVLVEVTGGAGSLPVGVSIAALGAIPACMGTALLVLARSERA
jgi:hypothetical protein